MPRLTDIYLGGFIDNKLVGVITLGWGVRPLHTIRRIFPSLGTQDYYEIGKLCMAEECPRNSESVMLSRSIAWLKKNTNKKVLYTWADGILGKPGYVYQAANFLYGGFIWTDLYVSQKGEKIHPRTSQGITNRAQGKDATVKIGRRPTKQQLKEMCWAHYRGKQFRYIYFLCGKKEQQRLLAESTVEWSRRYPKHSSLEWKIQNLNTGEWESVSAINFDARASNEYNLTVQKNASKVKVYRKAKEFFNLE
jgi:hypothetical protein